MTNSATIVHKMEVWRQAERPEAHAGQELEVPAISLLAGGSSAIDGVRRVL